MYRLLPFDSTSSQSTRLTLQQPLIRFSRNSVNLGELDLNLRPTYNWITTDAEQKVVCHQLMETLGRPPQFRPRKLALSGPRAESAVTLARIIYVHATRFRIVVLIDAQFEGGRTIPSLFDSIADSQTDRLILQRLRTGTKLLIALVYRTLKEDNLTCLTWNNGMDLSYKDWVDVAWSAVDNEFVYDVKTRTGGPSTFQCGMRATSAHLTETLT
jgi:hypothetical protein